MLAANLPYNVAVPVVLHLLAAVPAVARARPGHGAGRGGRPDDCAGPGSRVYGVPSVKLAWYAQARRAGTVPRTVFWPVPNVDSGLVAFTRRHPPDPAAARTEVFAVVDAAFAQRRKTLRAALAELGRLARRAAERICGRPGVDPGRAGRRSGSPSSPGSRRLRHPRGG